MEPASAGLGFISEQQLLRTVLRCSRYRRGTNASTAPSEQDISRACELSASTAALTGQATSGGEAPQTPAPFAAVRGTSHSAQMATGAEVEPPRGATPPAYGCARHRPPPRAATPPAYGCARHRPPPRGATPPAYGCARHRPADVARALHQLRVQRATLRQLELLLHHLRLAQRLQLPQFLLHLALHRLLRLRPLAVPLRVRRRRSHSRRICARVELPRLRAAVLEERPHLRHRLVRRVPREAPALSPAAPRRRRRHRAVRPAHRARSARLPREVEPPTADWRSPASAAGGVERLNHGSPSESVHAATRRVSRTESQSPRTISRRAGSTSMSPRLDAGGVYPNVARGGCRKPSGSPPTPDAGRRERQGSASCACELSAT
jgi:hypothetical protein